MAFHIAVALGNAIAWLIHGGTWWIRRRCLVCMGSLGFMVFLLSLLAAFVLEGLIGLGEIDATAERVAQIEQEISEMHITMVVAYASIILLGCWQAWLSKAGELSKYLLYIFSLFTEVAIAVFIYCYSYQSYMPRLLSSLKLASSLSEVSWWSYAITLLILALARPWVLHVWSGIWKLARPELTTASRLRNVDKSSTR